MDMKRIKILLEITSYMTTIAINVSSYTGELDMTNIYSSLVLIFILFFMFRLWNKIDNHKLKILALKKYTDNFHIEFSDHLNKEIKKLEQRCVKLETKAKTYEAYELTEDDKLSQKRELDNRTEKIKEYNSAFEDWKVNELGKGTLQTLYKTFSEFIDVK